MADELLDRASELLAAGDRAFYEPLREAWRACRCAALAELVERAGKLVAWDYPIKSPKAWQAAWTARVRDRDPLVLGALLAGLREHVAQPKGAFIAACLDEIVPLCADEPQVTRPLIGFADQPFDTPQWKKVQTRVYQGLVAADDPRAIEWLGGAIERAQRKQAALDDDPALKRPRNTRGRLEGRFPAGVPKLPDELAPIVARINAQLDAKPGLAAVAVRAVDQTQALLDAIYADPSDDAKRLVYADSLQPSGDPRGELIVAQLAGTPEAAKRANALVAKHRHALLGPLAKAVGAATVVFERGFLARCTAGVGRKLEVDAMFGRIEWATVTHLQISKYGAIDSKMRALVEATGVPDSGIACLATATFPQLEVLGLATPEGAKDGLKDGAPASAGLRALAAAKGMPKLRELRLELNSTEWRTTRASYGGELLERDAQAYAWLWTAPWFSQLDAIVVSYHLTPSAASWIPLLRERAHLRTLAFRGAGNARVTKTGDKLAAVVASDTWSVQLGDALAAYGVAVELAH
ncbi:MAG TPA: TIGR02996 domain-containing protein [Kofleriaceae bacterium]|jgi:uncharacterized protein (TIGR02996 family)|nr:TIGR02996 domain-containing protein [Kofleriaceae bacterium]